MEKFPENSMVAFNGALRVGVHGLETGISDPNEANQDVHISQDGVVVICHDAHLKRCYGVDASVTSLPWKNGLDQLRTVREPHVPMITFRQLLQALVSGEPANGSIARTEMTAWRDAWILMDIKVDTNFDNIRACGGIAARSD
jgi:phosphatidylglycerol phospholipase C